MKQVLQNISNGETVIADLPVPNPARGSILVRTTETLISAGTERMLVDFGRAGWLDKARQQPDKVKMVLEKLKADGLFATLDSVTSKLDQPIALGYCNVGVVSDLGEGVSDTFSVGDRVVSNGNHAEFVSVPENLCARVPDSVSDEQAVFTVLGAIGMQGVRLAQPTLGECFVVTGLGLIGLLTVQILRANGCRVLGIDFDEKRLDLAKQFGAEVVNPSDGEDPVAAAERFSRGRGVDGVIIAASSKSNEPVSHAARMCRKRGRIVLVGVTGLELSRADFYEKELSFQVSCSYGPGRYDSEYEEKGRDYPVGFVRWTEQRNFEAVLDLMASGKLDVDPLIAHRYSIDDAVAAYETLVDDKSALGILLEYGPAGEDSPTNTVDISRGAEAAGRSTSEPIVGVIGAGNYSGRVLLPAFRDAGARIKTLVNTGGVGGVHYGKKFGVDAVSSDAKAIFDDPVIDAVVIATRHDSHADLVLKAIEAGKHVFVEKPLCLTLEELASIEAAMAGASTGLTVGFNRRFSPLIVRMQELMAADHIPKSMVLTVNAGAVPADHWTRDPAVGGGRIVGEACHFVDLLRHIAGSPVLDYTAVSDSQLPDSAIINLRFADGSLGSIQYLANGSKKYPKERLDVFAGGKALRLDNFRRLDGWGWSGFSRKKLWRQDKGQAACVAQFLESMRVDGNPPIDPEEIFEVSKVSIELGQMTR